jgi:signal transduction histidine kinase/ActR/RegA family two-component response regulator
VTASSPDDGAGLTSRLARAEAALVLAADRLADEVARRERLEESHGLGERRQEEFLAILAHELRNPLAPILNAAQAMRLGPPLDAEIEWCRDVIERQSRHLSHLVDDLLDIARLRQGRIVLRPEPADLAEILRRAVETARPAFRSRAVELSVSLPETPVRIVADVMRTVQAVSYLLDNAAKQSERGGRVRLVAAGAVPDDGSVVVRVEDDGVGIAAESLPHVFEPFAQSGAPHVRSSAGPGLGLALARRLAELHGGSLEASSAGERRGSEFTLRLPLGGPAQSAAPAVPSERRAGPVPRRMLVVDDDPASATTMTLLLRRMGHDVMTAFDGTQAIRTAEGERPDVALLDIGLPDFDGFEVARRIRSEPWGRTMLLVAMTGWGDAADRRRSRESGFDDHLVKPVDLAALDRILSGSASPAPAPATSR